MTDLVLSNRRLSPNAKRNLSLFARYATIIGLALMLVAFSILSPKAFPTLNNFTNVINQASLAMMFDKDIKKFPADEAYRMLEYQG